MKLSRASMPMVLLAGVFFARSAWANDPPALPAWLAEFSIVPLALMVFAWSGAARLFDETGGRPSSRKLVLILSVVVTFFSGMHEGFAAMTAPVLCLYAIFVGLGMIHLSWIAPKGSLVRKTTLVGGVLLIPTVIFLASFTWVFMGSSRYSLYHFAADEGMPRFYNFQREYSKAHDGKYQEFHREEHDRADRDTGEFGKQWIDSGMFYFDFSGDITEIAITYGADMKSYQIKVKPIAFIPWPYRIFSPRKAYFMSEDGVVRYETCWTAGCEATAASPRLK